MVTTMMNHSKLRNLTRFATLGSAASAVLVCAATSRAQTPPAPPTPAPAPVAPAAPTPPAATPPAPPATPPAAATPAPAPAPATPAPAAPAPAPAPDVAAPPPPVDGAVPPTPAPVPEEAAKPVEYKITTGLGLRFGAQFQNFRRPKRLGTFHVDEIYAEPRFSGQVLGFVGWTANLAVYGNTPATVLFGPPPPPEGPPVVFEARAMDLVAQLDFMDEFHLWGGRMLTPSDRTNFSGPWFISPWDYPGVYSVPGGGFTYVGPRGTEEIGREVGVVAWGDIGKGKFKYYGGVMDLDNVAVVPSNTPLYTGRVAYAFIGDEPGFYGSSTYYGAKDILALGVAVQYQKRFNFAGAQDDLLEINADLLAEFNVGDAGTITAEGAYYHVDSGKTAGVMPFDDAFFAVLSFLTPAVGPGKLQPLVRYQRSMGGVNIPAADGTLTDEGPDKWIGEAQVNYVMKDYFAKLHLGFQHTDLGRPAPGAPRTVGNALQFGFQIQQ
jgi:hypothetical protein